MADTVPIADVKPSEADAKKKKNKKKPATKGAVPSKDELKEKKVSKQFAKIKAELAKRKEEEERIKKEEEEAEKRLEEERLAEEERERKEREKRERRKQKEKERRLRLKEDGKLLTEKQKEDRRKAMELFQSRGLDVPDERTNADRPRVQYSKLKKRPTQTTESKHPASTVPISTVIAVDERTEEDEQMDSWEVLAYAQNDVKDHDMVIVDRVKEEDTIDKSVSELSARVPAASTVEPINDTKIMTEEEKENSINRARQRIKVSSGRFCREPICLATKRAV